MSGKLCLFFAIVVQICLSVSQEKQKARNYEEMQVKLANPDENITLKDLHLLIEDNRLLTWNLLKQMDSIMKDELNTKIDAMKMEFTTMMTEVKSDLVKGSEKLSSEINNVNLEVSDLKLKVDEISENKILNKNVTTKIDNEIKVAINKVTENVKDMNMSISGEIRNGLNELKQIREQNNINSTNIIITKLNEINRNANSVCENNKNAFRELLIQASARVHNCAQLLVGGDIISGIRLAGGIQVLCDQVTEGGGWTVFQVRDDLPIRENFYRTWVDYAKGFGNLDSEFWLGLETLHRMTKYTAMELRVDLEDINGATEFIKYDSFSVESSSEKFRLNLGNVNAGNEHLDDLSRANQMKFSTLDQDNDMWKGGSCANQQKGGWWYKECTNTNLNGYQFVGEYSDQPPHEFHGIYWYSFRGYYESLKRTRMMFRPRINVQLLK